MLEGQQDNWNGEYDATIHKKLNNKAESTNRDDEIRNELVVQEWESLLANDNEMKALMARIEGTVEEINEEWLKNIDIDNLENVDVDEIIKNLQPEYAEKLAKMLNVSVTSLGTALVALSSGVGL